MIINRNSDEWQYIFEIVKELFPFDHPFKNQLEYITDICYGFCVLNKKHIIFEGPTGTGKSVVAYTAALVMQDPRIKYVHRARFITVSINLQDQYRKDFPLICSLKSKFNYACPYNSAPFGSYKCIKRCNSSKKTCHPKKVYMNSLDKKFLSEHNIDSNSNLSIPYQINESIKDNKTFTKDLCPYLSVRERYLGLSSLGSSNIHFFCLSGGLQTLGLSNNQECIKSLYNIKRDDNLHIYSLDDKLAEYILKNDESKEVLDFISETNNLTDPKIPTYSDFVVLDECHKLEETLLDLAVLEFNPEYIDILLNDSIKGLNKAKNIGTIKDVTSSKSRVAKTNISRLLKFLEITESKILPMFYDMLNKFNNQQEYIIQSRGSRTKRYSDNKNCYYEAETQKLVNNLNETVQTLFMKLCNFDIFDPVADMTNQIAMSGLEYINLCSSEFTQLDGLKKADKELIKNLCVSLTQLYDTLSETFSYLDIMAEVNINAIMHLNHKINDKTETNSVEVRFSSAASVSKALLFNKAYRFLHMSASVCGYQYHIHSLGLNEDDCLFIESEPIIPVENRQIICKPIANIRDNNVCEETKKVTNEIDNIIRGFRLIENKQRCFIYTPSFALAETIMNLSKYKSYIEIPADAKEGVNILEKAMRVNQPKIIISPSIVEGVDLKGDLCRLQIIPKIPFLYLGDELVKIKLDINNEYYGRTTLLKLIQVTGRSIRGKSDYAETYILDNRFKWFLSNNMKFAPKWWLESIKK